ncbi:MAG: DUF4445 domain-containing protein [Firmicutes bacterium]|nr:DUF4445 domain-containing protein [Bacillota bacterium]
MLDVTINLPERTMTVKAAAGENLLQVLRTAGVKLDTPCNGSGTCGKCRVRLDGGRVERRHRGRREAVSRGELLACTSYVTAPLVVTVPRETLLAEGSVSLEQDSSVFEGRYYRVKKAFETLHGKESHVQAAVLKLAEPTLDDNLSDVDRLGRHLRVDLGRGESVIPLDLARKLPHVLRENNFQVAVVYSRLPDGRVALLDVKAPKAHPGYGIAVDVGTTSVAACLVDLATDKILAEGACANAQSRYGADVINRVIFATRGNGLQLLQDAVVRETINPLIEALCRHCGIGGDEIVLVSVAANTVMTHLLLGIWPDFLRREPYIPALTATDNLTVTAVELGLCVNKNAPVLLAPSVASYVGGDITAGVAAAFLRETEQNSMLIDLGTNGEIVLGNSEFAMTCACSAGPAFEGGEISCGMRAAPGAIEAVAIDGTYTAHLKVIGGQKPAGICGSGLIDLIAELKRTGLIDARGRFRRDVKTDKVVYDSYGVGRYIVAAKERYAIPADIYLTEIDIDNFIRAKAAVYSAACVLLSSLGLDFDDLAEIKVAGGIGNHINIANAVRIGLFPDINPDKFNFIGNSSLTGSYLSLVNKKATDFLKETAQQMTYLELSVYPGYMDEFVSASFIPHTDTDRFPSAAARA